MTVISAILIWILAAIFAIPDGITAHIQEAKLENNSTILYCDPYYADPTYIKYNVVAKSLIYYIIPLCVISAFYILMARTLHASANQMPGELQGAQSLSQARARRHVARMVLIFVFCKFITFNSKNSLIRKTSVPARTAT